MGAESAAQVAGPGSAECSPSWSARRPRCSPTPLSFLVSLICLRAIRAVEPAPPSTRPAAARDRRGAARSSRATGCCGSSCLRGRGNLVLTGYGGDRGPLPGPRARAGRGRRRAADRGRPASAGSSAPWSPRPSPPARLARALLLFKIGATPFGLLIPLTGPGGGWRCSSSVRSGWWRHRRRQRRHERVRCRPTARAR